LITTHYIIIAVVACSFCGALIFLIDFLKKKKVLRAQEKTWGKLKEISERNKDVKNLKTWESLNNLNEKE
jgi:hypothetical protein